MTGAALEQALAARLETLLRGVGWLRGWRVSEGAANAGYDFMVTLPLPGGGKAALCVECKRELRPSAFRALAGRVFSPAGRPRAVVPMLALPWMSPRLAELCAEQGWSWFDLAGNCRLDVPGLLRLERTGKAPVHARPQLAANPGTPEAGRVIRAMLLPEQAGKRWTQREMQVFCRPRVSLGLVNKVVRHLREEAFLEAGGDDGFRLRDPLGLLYAWRDAYRFDRHERRGCFTLMQGNKLHNALARLGDRTNGMALYAAFSAADFQAPHVRQPKTWLYLRDRDASLFEKLAEAKRVDSGENIVLLVPDDEGVFHPGDRSATGVNDMGCTDPVQTYADLSHCGGRGEEAAEALLNQRLKPEWRRRGYQV